jgi:exodeoxyribonuclease-3
MPPPHHLEHQFGAPAHQSVARFIKAVRPDILCLQETKCPDDRFPFKRFKRLGYENVALNGQKGYHGVVVLSRRRSDRARYRRIAARLPPSRSCSASARGSGSDHTA